MHRGAWLAAAVVCVVCVACGARTDLDEPSPGSPGGVLADASTGGSGLDASTGSGGRDALADVPSFSDDASAVDTGAPDASCTAPVVDVGECQKGDPSCCKFYVLWTCGDVTYAGGGRCGPTPDASPADLDVSCFVDGQSSGSVFTETVAACQCGDPKVLAAIAEAHCP